MYKHFAIGDFEEFVAITKNYCLSENKVNCKRYQAKKSGKTPPPNLLPDGNFLAAGNNN
jgi:hypothetical protein